MTRGRKPTMDYPKIARHALARHIASLPYGARDNVVQAFQLLVDLPPTGFLDSDTQAIAEAEGTSI
jgi:hypothetical protein